MEEEGVYAVEGKFYIKLEGTTKNFKEMFCHVTVSLDNSALYFTFTDTSVE